MSNAGIPSDQSRLHFDHPPVKQVYLRLRFRPDGHIQGSHVAPLRRQWEAEYPVVSEEVPTPNVEDSESGPELLVPGASRWPLPYTTFSSQDRDETISFQGDSFELGWAFSAEESRPYPGFDALFAALAAKYGEFTTLLGEAGIKTAITSARCLYINKIDGMNAAELAVGMLTGWSGIVSEQLPAVGYAGCRIHACADERSHGCTSEVGADGDMNETDSELTISVLRRVQEGDDEWDALRAAHEELDELFVRFTPKALHEKWGRTA